MSNCSIFIEPAGRQPVINNPRFFLDIIFYPLFQRMYIYYLKAQKTTAMDRGNMKDLHLDELQKLLTTAQRNLTLSQMYRQGSAVIEHNKRQIEKVQAAIANKLGDPLPNR